MKLFEPRARILIFIPAKNEAATIASVVEKSRAEVQKLKCGDVTVLVINDSSTDDTATVAQKAGATVLSFDESVGLGTVFQDAVMYATENDYDYMVTIDGDGQFAEIDIPKLLNPLLNNHADMVTGSRFLNDSKTIDIPKTKLWGNYLVARVVSSIIGKKMYDVSCGFRAYNKKALHHLNLFGGYTYTQKVLLTLGHKNMRVLEVPITTNYFKERKSRIAHNLFTYGWSVLKIILSAMLFYRPMKFFGLLAFLHLVLSVLFVYLPVTHYIATGNITPYKALGVLALVTLLLAFFFVVLGMVMQSVSRIQLSIDRVLYYQKRVQR